MNESKYFSKSKSIQTPKRCPILNYCSRRAYTLFFFSGLNEYHKNKSIIGPLLNEGLIPEDFDAHAIPLQGESPTFSRTNTMVYYHNMCPEVNLFDSEYALPFAKGLASTDGEYDSLRVSEKFINQKNKHYSECAEYAKVLFEKNFEGKKSIRTLKKRRAPISSKLRFEIFQRDDFTCQYCNRTKDDGIKLEIDHIVPIENGGKDDYDNLITSCTTCNNGKSNKII